MDFGRGEYDRLCFHRCLSVHTRGSTWTGQGTPLARPPPPNSGYPLPDPWTGQRVPQPAPPWIIVKIIVCPIILTVEKLTQAFVVETITLDSYQCLKFACYHPHPNDEGRLCFHINLSVNRGRGYSHPVDGGYPHLANWGYPSQVRMGYPLARTGWGRPLARTGRGTPPGGTGWYPLPP